MQYNKFMLPWQHNYHTVLNLPKIIFFTANFQMKEKTNMHINNWYSCSWSNPDETMSKVKGSSMFQLYVTIATKTVYRLGNYLKTPFSKQFIYLQQESILKIHTNSKLSISGLQMLQTKSNYLLLNVRYHGNPNINGQLPYIKTAF